MFSAFKKKHDNLKKCIVYHYIYIFTIYLLMLSLALTEEWKESIIVPIYKKGDKTDCNNYRGISLLPTTYKILYNILLSRVTPYTEEIIGDHQCGFWHNRSTTDHLFCTRQMLEKKWEYTEAVHQLFISLRKLMIQLGGRSYIIFLWSLGSPRNW